MKIKILAQDLIRIYLIGFYISFYFVTTGLGKEGFSATPFVRVFYVLTLAFLYFCIFFMIRGKLFNGTDPITKFMKLSALLGVLWLVVGLHNFNFYYVSDSVYFYFMIFSFFAFVKTFKVSEGCQVAFVNSIKVTFLLIAILLIASSIFFEAKPFFLYLPIAVYFVSLLLTQSFSANRNNLLIVGLCLILAIPDLNRAFYLQFFLLALFGTFIIKGASRTLGIASFIVVILLSIFVIFTSNPDFLEGSQLHRRYHETANIFKYGVSEEVSIPMLQRLYEKEVILDSFYDSPLMSFAGFGFGAFFDMSDSLDVWLVDSQLFGGEQVHNVHFLHMALLYRYGIVGVLLYTFLLVYIFIFALKIRKSKFLENENSKFIIIFGLSYVVSAYAFSSTASSNFFVDPMISFSLAMLAIFSTRSLNK